MWMSTVSFVMLLLQTSIREKSDVHLSWDSMINDV